MTVKADRASCQKVAATFWVDMMQRQASLRMAPAWAGLALLCLLPASVGAKDGPYLNWRAKTVPVQQADAPQPIQAPQVPVPPSPYGQVGDPYLHVLNWRGKTGGQAPQPVATTAPMRRAPVQAPVQATAPAESASHYPSERQLPPSYRMMAPQYRAQPMASTLPEPVEDGPAQPPARQPLPALAPQVPQAAPVNPPAPAPRPAPAPVAQAPVAPPAARDGAYQVPATSPYAARIAAARAAQAKAQARAEAPAQPQAAAAKPTAKATARTASAAPAPVVKPSDAPVTETADDGKPFVPGQHYSDASEAPRLYSLHRDYGLKPDPITIDTNASGALLDTSRLDAAEAKAAKDEKADEESAGDDRETGEPEADDVPAKSATHAPDGSTASPKTRKVAQ